MAGKDWLDRLFKINNLMFSTEFDAEATQCRKRINTLLLQHGKTANDIPELLDIVRKRRPPTQPTPAPPPAAARRSNNRPRTVHGDASSRRRIPHS